MVEALLSQILNLHSDFDVNKIAKVRQRKERSNKADQCAGEAEEW